MPAQAPNRFVPLSADATLASRIIDVTVTNPAGDVLGEVVDLAFDEGRTLRAVVVAVSVAPGAMSRFVAVDPAAFTLGPDGGGHRRALLAASLEEIRAAPAIRYRSGFAE
ncbi:MAG: PRC-barrel domain-containing protein [Methylobacteriaceae bacterium]|nr:PRC-barrel domain-containing protein [Methylobacteriaceae bacterium]